MNKNIILKSIAVILILIGMFNFVLSADPEGAAVQDMGSETKTAGPAGYLNTSGGTFTTLLLNATTQNLRWKAYAGNVTGRLTLDDASNSTIYDWGLTTVTGEVYTSRWSNITWDNIGCANQSIINTEETELNITTTDSDSINTTFVQTVHKQFYVGTTKITNSTCRSIATYLNDSAQSVSEDAKFQEILLDDDFYLVYASLIDNDVRGFNEKWYDFQMIVPENASQGSPATKYYFWLELI